MKKLMKKSANKKRVIRSYRPKFKRTTLVQDVSVYEIYYIIFGNFFQFVNLEGALL